MKSTLITLMLFFTSIAGATDISEATDIVCAKVKSCGTAQIEQQGLSPQMVDMMKAVFDGMCATMVAPYVSQATDAGLEKKAIACLDTINAMSCEELMQGAGGDAEECQELENAAKEAESKVESTS